MECIEVVAPSHLHVGNIDFDGGLGRLYGTIGFTLENPSIVVKVYRHNGVVSNDVYAERFADVLISRYGVDGVKIDVIRRFPEYVGLGYVTHLGFAIGVAISHLYDLKLSMKDIALTIKRGLLTALGYYACGYGGFIVEGGFRRGMLDRMVPPLIFRGDIPSDWIFVVVVPNLPRKKIVDMRIAREDAILREVSMDKNLAGYLSRLVLMKIIPSFIEGDLKGFGEGITEFNRALGSIWLKYQGGIYCCDIVEKGIEIILRYTTAACQSSWGPTFYGILDDENRASMLVEELRRFLDSNGGGDIFVSRGRNRGLEVRNCG
ncbi:beta-ribofuranosylaminobenzene 5'-phosphate synthase family [Ignisphaera aggregans DSM 17230]|uniref:Beta-ribofuranosylaminobenzene 5'-phosphate synthase n=1 Tax=Ignisphaera aggregans (strain DSM 17230 / JCM 13409 / AQ1.S1) TaxID=583356 RepID=E0SST8_IGNAA|nr:beta-ribofuranosylaminobenzene 5'-phosphate synthase family [Ignisphaera aggregans DSM 17230]